jgi:hypothetical protein
MNIFHYVLVHSFRANINLGASHHSQRVPELRRAIAQCLQFIYRESLVLALRQSLRALGIDPAIYKHEQRDRYEPNADEHELKRVFAGRLARCNMAQRSGHSRPST